MNTMMEMNAGKTFFGLSCSVDHQPGRTKSFDTFEGVRYDLRSLFSVRTPIYISYGR